MSEADVIARTSTPLTVESLAEQFAICGLAAGQTVLVHSAMSKLGWVAGGPEAVILALLRVLGPQGTLMMPAHTTQNTDPAHWRNPPVPASWVPVIRAHTPAYNPITTPTREMGAIAEVFRTWPGTIRSAHPIGSFAALGPNAADLTADHRLDDMFGDSSPLGKLYALDGSVLLLGVGHDNNTSLHLAENRATWPGRRHMTEGTSLLVDGVRQWVAFEMLQLETDDFELIGAIFEGEQGYQPRMIGNAAVRFFRQRPIVDFAVEWMERNRNFTRSDA
jgi:aminoglycoside 3-N-acetyltransferase